LKNKQYPLYQVSQISDLKELVNHAAFKYADAPAFAYERKKEPISVSYKQFKSDVDALGTALFDLGIQNAVVAVIGENSYEWILTYLAVVSSGNVIVPLDRELPPEDVRSIFADCGAAVFVFSDTYADIADHMQSSNAMILRYINMNKLPSLLERGNALIQQGEKRAVDYEIENKAMAAIIYTSGTTGAPKGVMLSHYAISRNAVAACQHVGIFGSNMLVLPLHHSFSFTAAIAAMLLKGSRIFINASLKNVLSDMGKNKPHNMFLVPLFVETFYKKIWEGAKKQRKDGLLKMLIKISNAFLKAGIDLRRILFKSVLQAFGGNLKLIVTGGAAIDAKYIRGFRDLGINVLNGYGITECAPIVSVNRNQHYRDGSAGPVLPCCDVKVINPDENGNGEICVMGDVVMLGYYNNAQATKEAFDGEWFKTGDLGRLDKDSFLFITGRKKNLIVLSNGKNVYPEDLEFALQNIPCIKEAAVTADGDAIVAEVFLDTENDPGCVSRLDGEIIALNRTLPAYKKISKTVIRDKEFPKTTAKKIKREYK